MKRLILGCYACCLALPLWALDDTALQWLQKMSHSHREISYQAVVTHEVDDQIASYKLIHAIVDGREFEYLEPLNSTTGKLTRRGHSLNCVHPADQLIRSKAGNGGPLARYYDIQVTGNSRVAGRDVVNIQIKPRDVYRLGYRLSLDADLGLPLRSEILSVKNDVLERYQYAMFSLEVTQDSLPDSGLEVSHSRPLSVVEGGQLLHKLSWRPHWVPAGFVLAQGPEEGREGDALSFTDGMALFTVFLEPRKAQKAGQESAMRHGASLVYSYPMEKAPYQVTVVGEIPVLTARQVAHSIRWKRDS